MSQPEKKVIEYRDGGCVFYYDREKNTLRVLGAQDDARSVINKLQRQRWMPKELRAIWFSGETPVLYTGAHLILYMASVRTPESTPKTGRTFKEIVNS